MKKLMLLFVLAFPMASQADYLDVIAIKMTGACSMSKYLQAVKDFNEQWGKSHGYRSEILALERRESVLLGGAHDQRRDLRQGSRRMEPGLGRRKLAVSETDGTIR